MPSLILYCNERGHGPMMDEKLCVRKCVRACVRAGVYCICADVDVYVLAGGGTTNVQIMRGSDDIPIPYLRLPSPIDDAGSLGDILYLQCPKV